MYEVTKQTPKISKHGEHKQKKNGHELMLKIS